MNCIDNINGKTNIYGIIGYPVGHSFSPVIHNTLSKILNHNIVYTPFEVKPENLKHAIKGAYNLGIKGLNITVPHKQEVINYLCEIDTLAEQIGAVNTLKYESNGYKGYNTDLYGLKSCLDSRGINLKDKNVVIIGAGGASKSIAIMCALENIKRLFIINRTINNAHSLAQNILKYYNVDIEILNYDEVSKLNNIDVCIQTTSIGMTPNTNTPIHNKDFFYNIKIAVDIIFNPWKTEFLKQAEQAGCQIINGFDMLYFQAVKSYEIWWDINISEDIKAKTKNMFEVYYNNL